MSNRDVIRWWAMLIGSAVLCMSDCEEARAETVQALEPVEIYRFGSVGVGDRLTNQFRLRNERSEPLEVESVTPSCECVQVMLWPTNVEAGSTGIVEVLFVPNKVGAVDYRVRVKTSSAGQPEFEYAIQGVVTSASRSRVDRDWALYLGTPESGQVIRNPGSVVLVDVRSVEAYERARIPGSLQIPLYAVKTKGFLRGRPVVLVDEGYGSHLLDEECRKLREMGFSNLSLWYGGLNAWRRRGGVLEGPGGSDLDRIPPIALHDIAYSTDWLVVTVGDGATNRWEGCLALAFDPANPEGFVAALNEAIQAQPQVGSVLIATETGETYGAIARVAEKINAFVFYLEGGWEAWEAHRKMMGAIQQGRIVVAQGTSVAGGVNVRPGCGGCPK